MTDTPNSSNTISTMEKLKEVIQKEGVIGHQYVDEEGQCCAVGHLFKMIDPKILDYILKSGERETYRPHDGYEFYGFSITPVEINKYKVHDTVNYLNRRMPWLNIYDKLCELGIDLSILEELQEANDKDATPDIGKIIKAIDNVIRYYTP